MKKIDKEYDYLLGVDRSKLVKSDDWLVLKTKKMDVVKVFFVSFVSQKNKSRKAEIYYPPDYDFKLNLPVVILFSVKKYPMNRGSYVSWAQILAANGIAAISYEAPDFETDFIDLLKYLNENNNFLSIDNKRIGIMAFCGALNRFFNIDFDKQIKKLLSYGVFFSGTLASPKKYDYNFPVLFVNSGKDYKVCTKSFSQFQNEANHLGIKYKMIDYPEGIHRFDAFQPTEESKKIIKLMIKEIRNELFSKK